MIGLVLTVLLTQCGAYKILVVPLVSGTSSHVFFCQDVASVLSDDHEVHIVVHKKLELSLSKLKMERVKKQYISLPDYIPDIEPGFRLEDLIVKGISFIAEKGRIAMEAYCKAAKSDIKLLETLHKERYDLVLIDSINMCLGGFLIEFLQIPYGLIQPSGFGVPFGYSDIPFNPAVNPMNALSYTDRMSFIQRVLNTAMSLFVINLIRSPYVNIEEFRKKSNVIVEGPAYNAPAIKIYNSNFALEYPRSLLPNDILVGGITETLKSAKVLPIEIEKFITDSKGDGVIFCSFGTLINQYGKWGSLFAKAFARLPQHVIWTFRGPAPEGLGSNTLLTEWAPQTELLAHNRTRLFITHAGMNSAMESIYYGVPVVAIPLLWDQFGHSTELTEHAGTGIQLDLQSLTEGKLFQSITDVISQKRFKENAVKASRMFQDQAVLPGHLLRHWVSHVIKHNTTSYYRSSARDLYWFQKLMLDIVVFVIVIVTVITVIIYRICKFIKQHICARSLTNRQKTD